MAASVSLQVPVDDWRPSSPPALELARALRTERLTLLLGEAGVGKTTLLAAGVLPLLHRRLDDADVEPTRPPSPVVVPFRERRGQGRLQRAEILVMLDAGSARSMSGVHDQLLAALRGAGIHHEVERIGLADCVQSLSGRFGVRFLFIFDGFDAALATADGAVIAALIELVNRPVPANVLLALRDEACDRLELFLNRLDDGDPTFVRRHRAAGTAPMRTLPAARVSPSAWPAQPPLRAPAPVQSPLTPDPPLSARARALMLATAALVIGAAVLTAWRDGPRAAPPAARAATLPNTGAAPLLPLASFDLFVDGEAGPLPRELAQALGRLGIQLHLRPLKSATGTAALGAGGPALALARYDELQAATELKPKPALRVIAPLYAEELQVVVRADSPLRYLHELEGRRINIGAADGARALTAAALYRRMFGDAIAPTALGGLDAPDALNRLAAGAALDAVLLVAAGLAPELAALTSASRGALRVLRLDPAAPASRRALQAYLPVTLPATPDAGGAVPTLAALQFLVSGGTPDDANASAHTQDLALLTSALCGSLPALQRDGHPRWRAVQPGLQLPTPWPDAAALAPGWRDCARADAAATSSTFPSTPRPGERP